MTTTETTSHVPTAEDERRRARAEIEELSHAAYDVAAAPPTTAGPPTECDVIMKGGITSGVVYPLTICRLATKYRLKSIGGTSAGAIAAVVAAAAEYRRQHDSEAPAEGYQALAVLPLDVSKRLATLFQPHPETEPIFGVLLAALGPGKVRAAVVALVRERLWWFLGGLLLVLVVAAPALLLNGIPGDEGWGRFTLALILPVLLGLVVGVVAALVGFALKAVKVLPRHDFGLTDGATHSGNADEPALTEWLNRTVNDVAGLPKGRCLTLGDLWGSAGLAAWQAYAAATPTTQRPIGEVRRKRAIDLETMTTNLTIRRPFRMPFRQQVFLFDRDEMLGLFPRDVVDTMVAGLPPSTHLHPKTKQPLFYFPGPGAPEKGERRPGPEALPLVVMARMSLSFPGLIAAVPLYAVDYNGDQSVVRHLFSDGGISSNFPMHFFDSLLPTRPTFGINLASPHPQHPEMTWLSAAAEGGVIPRAQPFTTVPGFVQALRDSVQNWSDNTQVTQRGYAERVVEIRLRKGEGGFNLEMPDDVIMALAGRGAEAGEKLLGFQWDPHRVIRYRNAMTRLSEVLEGFEVAWDARDYGGLVEDYPTSGAPGTSYMDGKAWREKDLAATKALLDLVEEWEQADWPSLRQDRPSPAPAIRMAPE
ncbi:Patatin-like phospholipase [Pedococcus dokdonensis]|uniref:Patatin-like phospholipase n=1 Tax=Pedococcus dokdonensis TaxID=443156 RepID=A0A1H0S1G4_9MICO|nr:patatin-like phospholipase family protein [Pedococcus dokdonensis]SDP35534.1 Patatin-like phospholipase [Pedococcus dokdonensis]